MAFYLFANTTTQQQRQQSLYGMCIYFGSTLPACLCFRFHTLILPPVFLSLTHTYISCLCNSAWPLISMPLFSPTLQLLLAAGVFTVISKAFHYSHSKAPLFCFISLSSTGVCRIFFRGFFVQHSALVALVICNLFKFLGT